MTKTWDFLSKSDGNRRYTSVIWEQIRDQSLNNTKGKLLKLGMRQTKYPLCVFQTDRVTDGQSAAVTRPALAAWHAIKKDAGCQVIANSYTGQVR